MNYTDFSHMPASLRNKVEMELRSGERIVWASQPIPKQYSRGGGCIVLFGIPWTAFAIFWTIMAAGGTWRSSKGFGLVFPLFGLPFILIGLGMLSSPYWMRRKAAKTVYLITDQRAIILSEGLRGRTSVSSYAPEQLQSTTREQNADGSGDVIFITNTWRDSDGDRRVQRIGFMGVPDVKAVEDHLLTLAKKASNPGQKP